MLLAHVPLAGHAGEIAVVVQHFGHRDDVVAKPAGRPLRAFVDNVVEVPHPRLMGIDAGHERSPRRAAARRVVELREADPMLGKCVDVGRRDLAAVAAEVGEAHVVDENHHDVRTLRRCSATSRCKPRAEDERQCQENWESLHRMSRLKE